MNIDIFHIVANIYTSKTSSWISELEESEVQPFILNKFLSMNQNIRVQSRWLDQYTFYLPPKMWLSLAWSVIPKSSKAPFVKYIKQLDTEEKLDFLIQRIRKHLQLSDNDWKASRTRILEHVNAHMADWFRFYGIEKSYWRTFNLDFNKMREGNDIARTKSVFDFG